MKSLQNLQTGIGKKVRTLREAKGWSVEMLANKANTKISYISEIQNGKRNPTLKKLKQIADALDVEVKELLDF